MYLQLPDSYKLFYVKNMFEEYVQEFFWIYYSIICNRYNMGTRDLPDIYAQAQPRATGPRAQACISGKFQVPICYN